MQTHNPSRRHFLQASAAMAGAGILQACGTTAAPAASGNAARPVLPAGRPVYGRGSGEENTLRVVATSGFAPRPDQAERGLRRLYDAGFVITNQHVVSRRYQRFAGSDAERIADFQEVAAGRVATPKVLMGLRGGYGAVRLLPHIDWASLGSRMREHGTLFFGFSDVCAAQLALLARGNCPSFAGPMLYSEFGKIQPTAYTMQSFIDGSTRSQHTIDVYAVQAQDFRPLQGTLWGGNLSVIASLVGTPYLPDIEGGILFLEDVSEQPYRIERMLQTLHLAGILKKQQAVVLGDFRMGNIRDVYDSSYDFSSVIHTMRRVTGIPILTGFPFGHVANKATFPLGAHAQIRPNGNGGYQAVFSGYPTLNPAALNLSSLITPVTAAPVAGDDGGGESE